MDNLPTTLLVKIFSHDLSLEDFKSLRCVYRNVRKKLDASHFWKMFYSYKFKNTLLEDHIVWKDLAEINYHILQNLSDSNVLSEFPFLPELGDANPQLIEIYLKLNGVDMVSSRSTPFQFLKTHVTLFIYESNDCKLEGKVEYPYIFIRDMVKCIMITPSKNFLKRIQALLLILQAKIVKYRGHENINSVTRKFVVGVLEWILLHVESLQLKRDPKNKIAKALKEIKVQMTNIGLDVFMSKYITLNDAVHKMRLSMNIKNYAKPLLKSFFAEFLTLY